MLIRILLVFSISACCVLFYGILFIFQEMEENSCRMTYMFQTPQFMRIPFKNDRRFPKYKLYAYYEGILKESAALMRFTGAPVIFVPGNSGSYRQVRSLASVALQKGIDSGRRNHLDYFTIDLNEEQTALFGGYLNTQKDFLKECVNAVLDLYKSNKVVAEQVILIGHSMGGVIAESLLTDIDYSRKINSIVLIASPVKEPVVKFDTYLLDFYDRIDAGLHKNRSVMPPESFNRCCKNRFSFNSTKLQRKPIDDVLIVTIGGGSRDLLVRTDLTYSIFSDISISTTSIPGVWLSTDHLCSVWCLQLVLVINRFLYSIVEAGERYQYGKYFIKDKQARLTKASHFFLAPHFDDRHARTQLTLDAKLFDNTWSDSGDNFSKTFKHGTNSAQIQMMSLQNSGTRKMLFAETINLDSNNWVYGCQADLFYKNTTRCSKATPLSEHVVELPSLRNKRQFINLNLNEISESNKSWTHLLLVLTPRKAPITLNVDIYNSTERTLSLEMPRLYSFLEKKLIEETRIGTSFYKINITDLENPGQYLILNVKPKSCSNLSHDDVAHLYIPWAAGFSRYHHFRYEKYHPLGVYTPSPKPTDCGASNGTVVITLYLNPECQYEISYQNSLGGMMSRVLFYYNQCFPSYMMAILLLSLKQFIYANPPKEATSYGKRDLHLINPFALSSLVGTCVTFLVM